MIAPSDHAVQHSLQLFDQACSDFGLSVNLSKRRFVVAGFSRTPDQQPLGIQDSNVSCVDCVLYLGSTIRPDGRSSADVVNQISPASRAFGVLRHVFKDPHRQSETTRLIYGVCILPVLLSGSEFWTPLKCDLRKLETFHHRCIRAFLSLS